jgi:hypothetical protein
MVFGSRTTATMHQDGGSFELSSEDFPLAEGLLRYQGVKGGVAVARRRYVLVVFVKVGIQEDLFLFSSLYWVFLLESCSCNIIFFTAKKKSRGIGLNGVKHVWVDVAGYKLHNTTSPIN